MTRLKQILLLLSPALLLASSSAFAQDEQNVDAKALIERMEALMRSDSAYTEMTMEIVTPDWRRSLTMISWDDRLGKRSFIHILSPVRDQDTTFLRLDYQLWMYLPRAERVVKIPPSMMLQSWMGSDFTNDDLVRESSLINDYTHEMKGIEEVEGQRCWVINLIPKEGAPVTWGRIETAISIDPFLPVRSRYYNRRGELDKEMIFSDVREMGGRRIPTTWSMSTIGKEGHATIIHLDKIEFDVKIPERIFTQQFLRNPR
jgi:outer membrane lipoprotein-sorting protein